MSDITGNTPLGGTPPEEEETDEETEDTGENSVLEDDPGFVGVSQEYRNAAYEQSRPLLSEDEDRAKQEEEAKEAELETAEAGTKVGFRGYEPTTPHPSEATQPADKYIEGNRRIMDQATRSGR